jgi:hypothetical protein
VGDSTQIGKSLVEISLSKGLFGHVLKHVPVSLTPTIVPMVLWYFEALVQNRPPSKSAYLWL